MWPRMIPCGSHRIPWENEVTFRLPVKVWRAMMEMYYPNSAWLCLRKDAFERLHQFKRQHGIPTWEAAIEVNSWLTKDEQVQIP